MKVNNGNENGEELRSNRPALVTAGARFSVLVHAITFVVGGLLLVGVNLLLSWLVDGRWLLSEPMAWWGSALFLHALAVALAPQVARLRERVRQMQTAQPGN